MNQEEQSQTNFNLNGNEHSADDVPEIESNQKIGAYSSFQRNLLRTLLILSLAIAILSWSIFAINLYGTRTKCCTIKEHQIIQCDECKQTFL